MRNMKFYRKGEDLFALKGFLFDGQDIKKGDAFDAEKLSKLQLERFFGLWYVGHKDDLDKRVTRLEGLLETPLEDNGTSTKAGPEVIEDSSDEATVEVVEDTDESFKVRYKGITKEIKRNQLREDGTLTKGALKLFN